MSESAAANRVFISCVSDEFQEPGARFPNLRADLRHYLSRADCEVKVQEDFSQTEVDILEKLDRYIRNCAAVVHLVGELPGAVADARAVQSYLGAFDAESGFLRDKPELRDALGDFSGLTYTQWEAYIALHHGVPLFVYANSAAAQQTHLDRLKSVGRHAQPFADRAALFGQFIGDLRKFIPSLEQGPVIAPSRILRHSPDRLFGRETELAELDAAWDDRSSMHVYSLIAWGGAGKTSLVAHWVTQRFVAHGWPDVERYFDWSYY